MSSAPRPLRHFSNTELTIDAAGPAHDEFYTIYGRKNADSFSNEKRLLMTLLADAADIILHPPRGSYSEKRIIYNQAVEWVKAPTVAGDIRFSFEQVCDYLEIDAALLRKRLLQFSHQPNTTNNVPLQPRRRWAHLSEIVAGHYLPLEVRSPR
jgi:hypothetical protein